MGSNETEKSYQKDFNFFYEQALLYKDTNSDSCVAFALNAFETTDNTVNKVNAMLLLAETYKASNNYQSALQTLNECEKLLIDSNNDSLLVEVYLELGDLEENMGNYDKAILQYKKVLDIHRRHDTQQDEANTLNRIGVVYKYKANYPQALEYHYKALRIFEELDNKTGEANSLGNIANVNEALNNYSEAIEIYEKILELFTEINDEGRIAKTLMNIGVINYYMGEYDKALNNFFRAKTILEKLGDKIILAYTLNNIACTYEIKGNYKEAINYFEKALNISRQINNKWNIANTLTNLAATKLKAGHVDSALKDVDLALTTAHEINATDITLECYKVLSDVYDKRNDYKKALYYYKLYKDVNDSLFNETKQKQISELNIKYQTGKKEKEIQELQINEQRRIILFISISVLLLFVIAIINFVLYRHKKRSHNFLMAVINSLTHPFCVFNVNNKKIELVNKAAKETSSPYSQHLNVNKANKISEDCTPCTFRNVISTKSTYSKEVTFTEDNGAVKHYEFFGFPFLDKKGNVERVIEYAVDVTEKKSVLEKIKSAFEREKELSDLKSQFISTTSHEFRTPLATLYSSVELIQHYDKTHSDDKKNYHITRIKNIVKYMTGMLEDILTINKAEANKMEFKPEKSNIKGLCNEILEDVLVNASDHHYINYVFEGKTNIVAIDEKLVGHILTNLLSNAIKYSPDGGQILFKVEVLEKQIKFTVRDEGIGIPEENFKNLFQYFYRAKNVGTISGAGLGLAIVKKSVEAHGGTIEFESKVGRGTTFIVTLPLG